MAYNYIKTASVVVNGVGANHLKDIVVAMPFLHQIAAYLSLKDLPKSANSHVSVVLAS